MYLSRASRPVAISFWHYNLPEILVSSRADICNHFHNALIDTHPQSTQSVLIRYYKLWYSSLQSLIMGTASYKFAVDWFRTCQEPSFLLSPVHWASWRSLICTWTILSFFSTYATIDFVSIRTHRRKANSNRSSKYSENEHLRSIHLCRRLHKPMR